MGGYIVLGIVAAVVLFVAIICLVIVQKIKSVSRTFFGTEDIRKGLEQTAREVSLTPRSVSGMTRLMEPQIMRDFPDFSWPEFRDKAENMLTSALLAVSAGNIDKLREASADIREQIANQIDANKQAQMQEIYKDIKIHQTEISNYHKDNGKCIITIQSAVQYYHYKISSGQLVEGSRDRLKQTKYNIQLLYIQDERLTEINNAVGTTCPNCGAPVRNLGAMTCEYCGLAVTPINIKVWSLHKIEEVDYNHV